MAWNVGTDSNLSNEKRKAQRTKIENNGLEWFARFQSGENGRAAAEKYAAKIEKLTGIKLKVTETYSVGVRTL